MGSASNDSRAKACDCEARLQEKEEEIAASFALCKKCTTDLSRAASDMWYTLRKQSSDRIRTRRDDRYSYSSQPLKEHLEAILDELEFLDKSGSCEEHQEKGGGEDGPPLNGGQSLWLAVSKRGQWRLQLSKDEATEFGFEVVNEEEVQQMVDYIRRVRHDAHCPHKCEPRDEKPTEETTEEMDAAVETPVTEDKVQSSAPAPEATKNTP